MKRILAVDDAPVVLKIIDFALSDEGFEVVQAGNAEQAKQILLKEKFDIGIFDVNMPGQNGIDLTREVLKMENGKDMKILILTTESGEDLQNQGKNAGAVGWIVKPFEGADLLELVKML